MYMITSSTPERANIFISNRTHKAITKAYARFNEGRSLFFVSAVGKPVRYIGFFMEGSLVKPSKRVAV